MCDLPLPNTESENVDFVKMFDFKNFEELNTQNVTFNNIKFEFLVKSPNCDCRDYRIVTDLFIYEIITKNGQKTINVFMKRIDDMNFSGLDLSYIPVDGLKVVSNNELKFEGFWTFLIIREIEIINSWARHVVEEKQRLKQENLQNILKVYDNYYRTME